MTVAALSAAVLRSLAAGAAPLPPLPGRDEAREAAHRELLKPAYAQAKPSMVSRALHWLVDHLQRLLNQSGHVPGGRWGLLLAGLLLAGLVALVVTRLRPAAHTVRGDALFDVGRVLTGEEHRALAEAAAARGEFAEAVRERLRAVVRRLEERGVLDGRPGRTTEELVHDTSRVLPSVTAPLRRGTHTFDEIWYGRRAAERFDYDALVEVDRLVESTRAVLV